MRGNELLDSVEAFLRRFVAYPSSHALVAHVLWIAHCWFMDRWDSTPRIAFISTEPGSGKSRALEVSGPLVPRPTHAVNCSPAYLFRKVSDPDGRPTILFDEIDTLFGPKARDNEDIRGMLNAGHRKGATAGRCKVVGKQVEIEELPAYCAVALAGLGDLPDTIRTRSVVVRMRRRAPGERVEPWRARLNEPEGLELAEQLARWSRAEARHLRWPTFPPGVYDRNADIWEALLAVADLAGGHWPERARDVAVALVTEGSQGPQTLGVQLLADVRKVFTESAADVLFTEALLEELHHIEESPWADLRGKPLDARGLASRLRKYSTEDGEPIRPQTVRCGDQTSKGYRRADLWDAWQRYLPPAPDKSVTTDTTATPLVGGPESVTDSETPSVTRHMSVTNDSPVTRHVAPVTDVTDLSEGTPPMVGIADTTDTNDESDGRMKRQTCRVCRESMTDCGDGATIHPGCDPEATR